MGTRKVLLVEHRTCPRWSDSMAWPQPRRRWHHRTCDPQAVTELTQQPQFWVGRSQSLHGLSDYAGIHRLPYCMLTFDGYDMYNCGTVPKCQIPHALTCPKVLGPQSTHQAIKTAMYSCVNWCGGKVAGGEPFLKPFASFHLASPHLASHQGHSL